MIAFPRTLFVGRGNSGVCWYRSALPAAALGADWLGVVGEPGALRRVTGGFGMRARGGRLDRATTSSSCSSCTAQRGIGGSPSSSAPA